LKNARVVMKRRDEATTVEAAFPLKTLGLGKALGETLKVDWGILTSNDGVNVKERIYWANATASGTADEATEARLEPYLWGRVAFPARADPGKVAEELAKPEDGGPPDDRGILKMPGARED